ncbi:hypothetical protein FJT64_025295 [Amphibalanus amphitrite]|uniref:Uncharacterized protein n=1 Tax=Amphibalanus amphitrite TaxID=1232801 RepID=A0A6A4WFJ9_AMPAM|nr:uncharacterized protein LOC122377939 [Amphibalanus amphitrite]KAF0302614.1 hypothetical protein FJT64_025295 [Amphibalanus amphitrite]
MEAFRLIVLCSVLAAAACQRRGQGSPTFCLELLKSENKAQTTAALLKCVNQVKSEVQRSGRQFQLKQHYGDVGRCIAQDIGLVRPDGFVNKSALEQRVRTTRGIGEEDRAYYLTLVPTCDTWDGCLTKHCKL